MMSIGVSDPRALKLYSPIGNGWWLDCLLSAATSKTNASSTTAPLLHPRPRQQAVYYSAIDDHWSAHDAIWQCVLLTCLELCSMIVDGQHRLQACSRS